MNNCDVTNTTIFFEYQYHIEAAIERDIEGPFSEVRYFITTRVAAFAFAKFCTLDHVIGQATLLVDHLIIAFSNRKPQFLWCALENLCHLVITPIVLPVIGLIGLFSPTAALFWVDTIDSLIDPLLEEFHGYTRTWKYDKEIPVVSELLALTSDIRTIGALFLDTLESPLYPETIERVKSNIQALNAWRQYRQEAISSFFCSVFAALSPKV